MANETVSGFGNIKQIGGTASKFKIPSSGNIKPVQVFSSASYSVEASIEIALPINEHFHYIDKLNIRWEFDVDKDGNLGKTSMKFKNLPNPKQNPGLVNREDYRGSFNIKVTDNPGSNSLGFQYKSKGKLIGNNNLSWDFSFRLPLKV
ncbi:MAG: hypothetical protein AAF183_17810, partial [Pseudomonadota bacterium]